MKQKLLYRLDHVVRLDTDNADLEFSEIISYHTSESSYLLLLGRCGNS